MIIVKFPVRRGNKSEKPIRAYVTIGLVRLYSGNLFALFALLREINTLCHKRSYAVRNNTTNMLFSALTGCIRVNRQVMRWRKISIML